MFPPEGPAARLHQDDGAQTLYPRLKELVEKGLRGVTAAAAADSTKEYSAGSSDRPASWSTLQLLDEVRRIE